MSKVTNFLDRHLNSTDESAWVMESRIDERAYPSELNVSDLAEWVALGGLIKALEASADKTADL